MNLPPEIQAAIAAERARRGLAWLGISPDVFGSPVVPLTWRHVVELDFARNAFILERRALLADVFDFLWRLHPLFRRPDGSFPNQLSAFSVSVFQRFRSARARRRLTRRLRTADLFGAEREIRDWIDAAWQDAPGEDVTERQNTSALLPKPSPHLIDTLAGWYGEKFGRPPAEILDQPVATTWQLLRAQSIRAGDVVIDPHAALVQRWFAEQRARRAPPTVSRRPAP